MKLIDLYNKIAKGEKPPYKIRVVEDLDINTNYIYDEEEHNYISEIYTNKWLLNDLHPSKLNQEIEIIKEVKEITFDRIDKIDIHLGMLKMTPTEKYISNYVNRLIENQKTLIKIVEELQKGRE